MKKKKHLCSLILVSAIWFDANHNYWFIFLKNIFLEMSTFVLLNNQFFLLILKFNMKFRNRKKNISSPFNVLENMDMYQHDFQMIRPLWLVFKFGIFCMSMPYRIAIIQTQILRKIFENCRAELFLHRTMIVKFVLKIGKTANLSKLILIHFTMQFII